MLPASKPLLLLASIATTTNTHIVQQAARGGVSW
jgi:hypothetical protein